MERLVWRQVAIPKGLSSVLELICKETIRHNPDCIYSFIADLLEKEYEEQLGCQQQSPNEVDTEESHLLGKNDGQENTSPVTSLENNSEVRSTVNSPTEVVPSEVNSQTGSQTPEQGEPLKSAERSQQDTPIKSPVTSPTDSKAQKDEDEIEKLLERSLDTKDIQDLLESGDFQDVSVAEDDIDSDDDEEDEEYEDEQPLVVIDTKKVTDAEEEDDYEDEEQEDEEEASDEEEKIRRNLELLMTEEASKSDSELNDAAIKIQAGFRGYQARKSLKKSAKAPGGKSREDNQNESSSPSPMRENIDTFDAEAPIPTRRRPGSERIRNSAKYRSGMVFNQPTSPDEILGYDDDYLNKAATKIQANVRGWMTRKDLEKRYTVSNDKRNAATKIQATVRGFLTRRRLAKAKLANRRAATIKSQFTTRRRSSLGLQLKQRRKSSLKLDQAAIKIQAAFRGYNVRKGKKSIKRAETEKSTPASPSTTTTMTPPPSPTGVAPTPTDTSVPSIPASFEQPQEDE